MRCNFTLTRLILIFRLSAILFLSNTAFGQDKPDCNSNGKDVLLSNLAKRDAGTQIFPHNTTKNWYNEAVANLEEREYFIRTVNDPGMFGAVNHAQHLGYLFNEKGYSVSNFNEDGSDKGLWHVSFLLQGIGRKNKTHESSLLHAGQATDKTLLYDYTDYTIRYDNERQGMEQTFLINKRPSGRKELQISIELEGGLDARTGDKDQLLLYTPGHPEDVKLVYDQLKVMDRNKKILPACLQVTSAHKLILLVDDSHATYPISVDPLNHSPGQTFQGNQVLGSSLVDASLHMLFGFSLSGAGDVNGDGTDDIIIGSPTFTQISAITAGVLSASLTVVTGAAFIYYGVASGIPSSTPSQVLQPTGLATGALFGYSVSTAGKFDGSTTRSGVVIGAPGDKITLNVALLPTLVATGKVYLYSGNVFGTDVNTIPAPSSTLSLTQTDFNGGSPLFVNPTNPFFGFSVSNAGNMDGDAFDDIVVGTPFFTTGLTGILAGRVDVYKGGATGIITTPESKIQGSIASQLFGFSVSGGGKVKGGTFDAIIAGAPGFLASTGQLQGRAYLFYGKSGGVTVTTTSNIASADETPLSAGSGIIASLFGFSVSTAGDVNGDGFDDVIVGEPMALDHAGAAGKAYIYYGSASGVVSPAGTILSSPRSPTVLGIGTGVNLLFGFSVGKAGNVTGDAAGDVLVGEPGSAALSNPIISTLLALLSGTSTISGQAYLYKGTVGTQMASNATPFLTISDPGPLTAPNLLGASVHYVGDVNHDGFDDFMIGSPNGTLDLGLNLSLLGTLNLPTGPLPFGGLIVSASNSNAYLYLGFTGPLPVNYLSFTGNAENTGVLLNWATAQEQNSSYFEVQRSTDNSSYVAIGQVTAAHNSSLPTNYSFMDASPAGGNNYYRLKEVDLDGNSMYSKIVSVNFGVNGQNVVAVYPNPAHESFQLQFKNMQTGKYEMSLFSPVGQVIQSRSIQVSNPASYIETVPLSSGLAEGTYIVRLTDQQHHVYISKVVVR